MAKQLEIERKIKKLEEDYYAKKLKVTLIELKATRIALHNLITRRAEKDILFTKQIFFELANKPNTEPAYVKPFRWSLSGFNYLGIKITSQIKQLYAESLSKESERNTDKMEETSRLIFGQN